MHIDPLLAPLIKEVASFFKEIVVSIISVGWMLFQFFIILMAFVYRESLAALFAGTIESLKMPGVDLQMRKKDEAKLDLQKQVVAIAEQLAEPETPRPEVSAEIKEEIVETLAPSESKNEISELAKPPIASDTNEHSYKVQAPEMGRIIDTSRNMPDYNTHFKYSISTITRFYKTMTSTQMQLLYLLHDAQIKTLDDARDFLAFVANEETMEKRFDFADSTIAYLVEAKIIQIVLSKYVFLNQLGFEIVRMFPDHSSTKYS